MGDAEVSLRPFEPGDAAAVERWFGDREAVSGLVEQRASFGPDDARRWVEAAARAEGPDRKWAVLVAGEPIGFTGLYGLGRATAPEIGILLGEAEARGRGVGRRAYELTLAKGFGELGAWRIVALVPASNERSRRLHEAVGFVYEGTLRRHIRRPDGKLVDCEVFGLLREDWDRYR